ncbi:unnamed protein product [Prunus armeniaca]
MVRAIFVDLGRNMGPIIRWGDVEEPRFGGLGMKGPMTGDHWLVRLGVFNTLGKVLPDALVASFFPSYASRHDNCAPVLHSWYEGVRSSLLSCPHWH